MSDLRIRRYPDKILRKTAKKVSQVSNTERDELAAMAKTMYLNKGVGLAALQVGIDKQLAVIDIGNGLIMMVNPSITRKEGFEICEEGCLSVPDLSVKIKRAKLVIASYLDENGDVRQLRADGLLARAVQHEIDHLSGTLIIDYMNPIKKMIAGKRLSKGGPAAKRKQDKS